MAEKGYDLCELLEKINEGSIDKSAFIIGALKDKYRDEFQKKYNYVLEINSKKNLNGKDDKDDNMIKGKALEDLVQFLFVASGMHYKTFSNIHTTTNEIDVLAIVNNQINRKFIRSLYDARYDKILCECKNYQIPVGVTFVGKFCHLTMNSHINIGIMFSVKEIAGTSRDLVQKTYYYREAKDSKVYIIDFSENEFNRFIAGESFFDIVEEKCNELELDVDFKKYFTNHPNECDVNQWISNENDNKI